MKKIILITFSILFLALPLFSQDPEQSAKLLKLINEERQRAGLEAYQTSEDLQKVAAIRAEEISKVFESKRPDGREMHTVYLENGIKVAYYGESIRTGYETASGIFKAMIEDPSDSSSILDMDYTHIGIGIYKNAKNTYWAILYCSLAE
ncbi:SCP-like extracellular protein [Brachyspira hampsonii 30446]|uniref:SCP-like extracellular protein n=1 Tax=Brachyspira hampsonii 30446 TaxID=1289135 RepID=A0A2U4EV42_9SPIR|nr:CAP domain-containing protein [Brachyspira hampsonii]EKV56638.1 SCP-like extracellular protein [Brachyspira hampsonii 30446]MBW5395069.1 CAP domain-containing protein [Brachyspira hampsonii]OEJ19453.1 serine protease [Brachyspira hampsonii]